MIADQEGLETRRRTEIASPAGRDAGDDDDPVDQRAGQHDHPGLGGDQW